MAKANKDGWIRHRGGECPVKQGTLVDVRYRDGYIEYGIPALEFAEQGDRSAIAWSHGDGYADIMAYRLSNTEDVPTIDMQKETPESLRARYIAAGEEIRANEVTIESRKAEIAQLEKEREELREKVRAMGLDFWDAQYTTFDDMSDPRNWKKGDIVQCIAAHTFLTLGGMYELQEDYNQRGSVMIDRREVRGLSGYSHSLFKFHSRPSN